MSQTLATICRDVPLDFNPEANMRREVDNDALYALFRLNLRNWPTGSISNRPKPDCRQPKAVRRIRGRDIVTAADASEMLALKAALVSVRATTV